MEDLPFTFWLAALAPLAAILYLLVVRHWKAATAAPVGYFLAVLVAVALFRATDQMVGVLTVQGIWDALFILYVVSPALFLYQVSKEAGAFDVIRRGIEAYTPNDLLHVLAFGWVFSSFLQGITGFGVPAVVTAPLLVAMRVRPLWAVAISLIGHSWANTFGTLAVAWEALMAVTDPPDPALTAVLAALMLLAANLLGGLLIAWFFGRGPAIREALPAVLVISAIHGLGQLILAPLTPTLSNLLPGTVALGATVWLGKSRWYNQPTPITDSPIMMTDEEASQASDIEERARHNVGGDEQHEMPLWLAMLPYLILIAAILLVRLTPPINALFSGVVFGLPFPRLETGLGFITEAVDAYRPFSPLTHPGTFLLTSALITFVIFRWRGDIRPGRLDDILVQTVRTSIPSAIAFFALIPLTKVMEGSGQTYFLAVGIASAAPGLVYTTLAPVLGILGSFMTSSNLSSNILFGPLQENTAAVLDLHPELVLAAQTAGGAVGNAIAPGNVLLAAGSVGAAEQSGRIIRQTMVYVLAAAVLLGLIALAAAWFFF
jgi:lactate permease